MLQKTLLSGNYIGAIRWSDGKMEAPMLPELPVVVRCYSCGEFFWVKDAPVLGYFEPHKRHPKIKEYTRALTIEEYAGLLRHKENLSRGREIFARFRLWWTINDLVRNKRNQQLFDQYAAIFEVNILALMPLLTRDKPSGKWQIAEMYREIRKFSECLDVLDTIYAEELRKLVAFTRMKAEKENSRVFTMHDADLSYYTSK